MRLTCPAPTNLHVTDSSNNTLAIVWTENGDAEQWNIQYRAGSGEMSSDVSYATSYLITDLQPNTEYQIQVQSVCGVQTSEWTPVVTASTTTGLRNHDRSIIVYPNPANNVVCVKYLVNNNEFSGGIQVCDVYVGKFKCLPRSVDAGSYINHITDAFPVKRG